MESMMLYSCPICGTSIVGMEWEESPSADSSGKDLHCPACGNDLNEDELIEEG